MAERQLSFQQLVMRLEQFWAREGCIIWQPHNVQVGAGTMNPASFLHFLGPEPWRVAYIEPSVRPADGRYAENPNRWQQYYQYQVVLKPDPGDPQEMYLRSLEAIGVDLAKHDIRFVEDNWESPALGAWGLGWEVWCDGQEITQFTYMQQAGGFTCDPVSVEITYGLERIMLFLQGCKTFLDITWDDGLTYGDLLRTQEVEHCTYNFEVADVERLTQLYRLYEQEALAALERGLVVPAHDYVLKCSHTFNVLDARGAIGVTERAAFFARMRDLTHQVAEAYLKQREQMGFPLLERKRWRIVKEKPSVTEMPAVGSSPHELLVEVGVEELPHDDLDAALAQLQERVPAMLGEARLGYERLEVSGTPRRLVFAVHGLAVRQEDDVSVVKGPPAKVAFDAEGRPTRAAEGFARRHGLDPEQLEVAELDGGSYVVVRTHTEGRGAGEVLAQVLPELIASLRFVQSMRWDASGVFFSRPIRWLLALLDDVVIPFEYGGLRSGRMTRGLRTSGSRPISVADAREYPRIVEREGIVLSPAERRKLILAGARALADEVGGRLRDDPDLVAEVANLVEAPRPILGQFSPDYLSLPSEVLITVMKKHQRYFALERDEKLLPYFITVRNGGSEGDELVREGNEAVVHARFADAGYFYRRDLAQHLEGFLPRLATLTFQEKLGSMLDKTRRLQRLVVELRPMLGMAESEVPLLERAALLCKADLASQMVIEFTSLQGVMGRIYALHHGEDPQVADAIFEHYLPRFAGDALPQGPLGFAIGVSDRLDSLVGLFAAGLEPSGSSDPYALRRAAAGLVQLLLYREVSLDLRKAIRMAAKYLPIPAEECVQRGVLQFIAQRLRVHLLEEGLRYDVVDASLAERAHDPYRAAETARGLQRWVDRPNWLDILHAYARCKRIVRDVVDHRELDAEALADEAEQALYEAYNTVLAAMAEKGDVDAVLRAVEMLVPVINRFFDEVLVMHEDEKLRHNRLALVARIADIPAGVVDLSRLEGF